MASNETGIMVDGVLYVPAAPAAPAAPAVSIPAGCSVSGTVVTAPDAAPAREAAARYTCATHEHKGRDGRPGFSRAGMFGADGHLVLRHGLTPAQAAALAPSA